ncbi:antichymotrypsin-2 isoform X4 [Frankliniella occidentalis]|uniref:Antichymotrypsin-2 isoform X4 n=1 Tax=Frankliniella occidentalis TaxID=133901 RepID=A0A9C6XTI2_FRAOC|nr:antichymotrypsin-2 isoform X4 [Frankliniella occidentalis]
MIGFSRTKRSAASNAGYADLFGFIGFLFCLLTIVASTMATTAPAEPLAAVLKSVNDFTLDLYLKAAEAKGPGKNILVSPLSASLVTAMVHAGARGKTLEEITKGLRYPTDKDTLEKGFSSLHDLLANTPNVTLEIANKVFVEKTAHAKLVEGYKKTITEVHKSDVESADFLNNHDKERISINNWVSDKTHEKIKDLLQPGVVTPATAMVLVNAIYFYGKWKEQFDKKQTYPEDFYITKSQTVKVPMMHMTKNMRYAEIPELDAKAVELCYTNENVCLQIILPNAKDGLEGLQQKLRAGAFDLSNIPFYPTKVQLSLPKFKLEETINIKDLFKKMGMQSMFEQSADFSGMFDGVPVAVSDAIQKTFMDVNEEGTEAAAATAFVVTLQCLMERPDPISVFSADHPYALRLVALVGGVRACLFTGSVSEFSGDISKVASHT